ncbi:MAG: transposase [Colwellia sp.]
MFCYDFSCKMSRFPRRLTSESAFNYRSYSVNGLPKKYFWGVKMWSQSFFVETIGNMAVEIIRKYFQNQLVEVG